MTKRRASLLAGLVALSALGAPGCTSDPLAPRVSALEFVGQSPHNTMVLVFDVSFEDSDADLADGTLTVFVNGRATSAGPRAMRDVFVENDLEPAVVRGKLSVSLELSWSSDAVPENGSQFELGVELIDGAGRSSGVHNQRLVLNHGAGPAI